MEELHTHELVGRSPAILAVMQMIERVAPTDATVLITGESGTGKELAARALHDRSKRRGGTFLAVNCGALPAGLVESELFGYEKGSFTGAVTGKPGLIERADRGTLFLDEITEMSVDLQVRLLRFLERRRFFRVGGREELQADVRIIAATNRPPLQAVRDGVLREDLLYRLAVFPIAMPALKDRGEDVILLAEHFLAQLNTRHRVTKRLGASAHATLRRHRWPGNVRELRNTIERAHILTDQWLEIEPLGPAGSLAGDGAALHVPIGATLQDVERMLIEATLGHHRGNKRRTAATLGCSVKTLYNKLANYDREDGVVPA
jgi:DNA-binding NtrC family response regulator